MCSTEARPRRSSGSRLPRQGASYAHILVLASAVTFDRGLGRAGGAVALRGDDQAPVGVEACEAAGLFLGGMCCWHD